MADFHADHHYRPEYSRSCDPYPHTRLRGAEKTQKTQEETQQYYIPESASAEATARQSFLR